jgi:predicted HNH restriction endonuclease
MSIPEKDLLLPALYIISKHGEASTTEIKDELLMMFNPTGEDAEILSHRKDTRFTQTVRNLLGSHYANNAMRLYTSRGLTRNSKFVLNKAGIAYLKENQAMLEYLFRNPFKYEDIQEVIEAAEKTVNKKRQIFVYSEDETVSEGAASTIQKKLKARSAKLKTQAIEHYRGKDGIIRCAVCNFSFEEKYGELGKDYIEIHHEQPIYQYSDQGFEEYITKAVLNVKPVCSNCHSMLHRKKGKPLSISELKKSVITTK